MFQFLRRHVPGLEHCMACVIQGPVSVEYPALLFHLPEKRCRGIRRQDVEGRALQPVFFDPVGSAHKYIFAVVIKAEDE